jgi:hypothetical protein
MGQEVTHLVRVRATPPWDVRDVRARLFPCGGGGGAKAVCFGGPTIKGTYRTTNSHLSLVRGIRPEGAVSLHVNLPSHALL